MKTLTLSYLLTATHICLGYKRRGFGAGYYNGYGGKQEPGETLLQAAAREIVEESTVVVRPADLVRVAHLTCIYPAQTMHVTVFVAHTWSGEPQETEEMSPEWFTYDTIPFTRMWASDAVWLPRVLTGEYMTGTVWFAADGYTVEKMLWQE